MLSKTEIEFVKNPKWRDSSQKAVIRHRIIRKLKKCKSDLLILLSNLDFCNSSQIQDNIPMELCEIKFILELAVFYTKSVKIKGNVESIIEISEYIDNKSKE